MIVRKKDIEAKWYKYEGKVEFLIRPFKNSEYDVEKNLGKQQFMFCLVDWKGITEEDKKTIFKCNKENKELFFDYYVDIVLFLRDKLNEVEDKMSNAIKN